MTSRQGPTREQIEQLKNMIETKTALEDMLELFQGFDDVVRIQGGVINTLKETQFTPAERKKRIGRFYVEASKTLTEIELRWKKVKPLLVDLGRDISKDEVAIMNLRDLVESLKNML